MLEGTINTEEIVEVLARGGWVALGVGVGVALLTTRSVRPFAKQAIKGYLKATEGLQRATVGARQGLQDLYAEARAEQQTEAQAHTSEAQP